MKKPEIVPANSVAMGSEAVTAESAERIEPGLQRDPETAEEAESKGPSEKWLFWNKQITAAITHERLFRAEAEASERAYFGPQRNAETDGSDPNALIKIQEKTALLHANIEVLKPLVFSDTPQPLVRRRFNGDFNTSQTALMATEACQRLADFILDTEDFDGAMKGARDDRLIAGRGEVTVVYSAKFEEVKDPVSGAPVIDPVSKKPVKRKVKERVSARHREWRTVLFCPEMSWEDLPWQAVEHNLTRAKVEKRFGKDKADRMAFNKPGLANTGKAAEDDDRLTSGVASVAPTTDTQSQAISPFDTVPVMEIWDKESEKVIWWSSCYTDDVLDEIDDPLQLDDFFPMPRPLLATTKGRRLTPRPDIRYYEQRAEECEIASRKMREILEVIAVAGLIPAGTADTFTELFSGKSQLIPVTAWINMLQKGSVSELVQWLPLAPMISALQALQTLRMQARDAMFEASGVSDVMRAATDPNETLGAQEMKGRFSGMRLSNLQREMATFALDTLRLMIDVATGLYDTATIAEICGMELPLTEAERQAEIARREELMASYQAQAALHQAGVLMQEQLASAQQEQAAMAQEGGMQPPPPNPDDMLDPGPPPEPPQFDKPVPETSWELVHECLRNDFRRKIVLSIETSSTILSDEASDKEARVEFIQAFASFVTALLPMVQAGQMPLATMKEMLLFGVRGFPKSRSLEILITQLPDELPTPEAKEEASITVANIRAEVEKMLQDDEQAHELRLKGIDLVAKAADLNTTPAKSPDLPPDPTPKPTPSKARAKK
jgi:hypothetical protein